LEAQAWNSLGNLLKYHPKLYQEAEQAYRRAIDLDPGLADPWNGLGNLLQNHLKRPTEAEQAYKRAIDLDPQFDFPWINLGDLLQYRLDRYEESEHAYRRAIELNPWFDAPWAGLGNLLQDRLERYEESEQAYRRAIELDPQDADSWNNLGNLLQDKLKQPTEAEKAYRRAIELDSVSPYPWSNLRRLLDLLRGPNQEAGEAALRAFEIDPKRSWDLDRFIETCNRLVESPAELPALLKMTQKAHELAPDHPETQFLLARILTASGRWPEASQLLEQLAANEAAFFSNDFFRTVLKTGHLGDVIVILERTAADDRWRPVYEALRAARAGTPDYLRTVAPEVRMAATKILRDIDPSLFPDGEPSS
jgi:tetratricopeptide (TPR) repeat protein